MMLVGWLTVVLPHHDMGLEQGAWGSLAPALQALFYGPSKGTVPEVQEDPGDQSQGLQHPAGGSRPQVPAGSLLPSHSWGDTPTFSPRGQKPHPGLCLSLDFAPGPSWAQRPSLHPHGLCRAWKLHFLALSAHPAGGSACPSSTACLCGSAPRTAEWGGSDTPVLRGEPPPPGASPALPTTSRQAPP